VIYGETAIAIGVQRSWNSYCNRCSKILLLIAKIFFTYCKTWLFPQLSKL